MNPLFATGARTSYAYVPEVTFGVTPAAPSMKQFRIASGAKLDLKRNTFTSKEVRPDRQIADMRYGNKQSDLSLPFELSYGAFDDFLEAFMGGTWTANVLKTGNTLRSFSVEAGAADIGAYEVYRGCCVTGFDLSVQMEKIVEGAFTLVGKDLVLADCQNQSIAVDATAKTFTRLAGDFLADGFVVGMPFTGVGFADAGNNGSAVTPFIITAVTATVITASAATGLVTKTTQAGTGLEMASLGTPAVVAANAPYDSFTGLIKEGGTTIGYVTGITLKGSQNLSPAFALMSDSAQDVTQGLANVNGTLTAYFKDQTLKKKFLNGIATSVEFALGSGTKVLNFNMPKVYYTGNSRSAGETTIVESIPFQAVLDSGTSTNLQITRTP